MAEVISEVAFLSLTLGMLTSSEVQRVSLCLDKRLKFDSNIQNVNHHLSVILDYRVFEIVLEVAFLRFTLGILTSSKNQRVSLCLDKRLKFDLNIQNVNHHLPLIKGSQEFAVVSEVASQRFPLAILTSPKV